MPAVPFKRHARVEPLVHIPAEHIGVAGHNHRDGIEDIDLGASIAVQVRTAALGYGVADWRRIRLLEDGIGIYATGSKTQLQRTIRPSATAKRPAA